MGFSPCFLSPCTSSDYEIRYSFKYFVHVNTCTKSKPLNSHFPTEFLLRIEYLSFPPRIVCGINSSGNPVFRSGHPCSFDFAQDRFRRSDIVCFCFLQQILPKNGRTIFCKPETKIPIDRNNSALIIESPGVISGSLLHRIFREIHPL